jgi:hypothetical protein
MNQLQTKQKKQDSIKNPQHHTGQSPPAFSKTAVHPYLQAQGIIGNHGILHRHSSDIIQAKLKIGQPNDKYEQEADRIADQVMRMSESSIQRKPKCPECMEEDEQEILRPKQINNQTPTVTSNIESGINLIKGSGQPLPEATRSFFEPRFGADFSQVRVHSDSNTTGIASSVNAKAFTTGKDVVFGAGQYSPETNTGKRLLAHELAHVVQQEAGQQTSKQLLTVDPERNDYERKTNYVVESMNAYPRHVRETMITFGGGLKEAFNYTIHSTGFDPTIQRKIGFDDCDRKGGTQEEDTIRDAHQKAQELIQKALVALKNPGPVAFWLYRDFGIDDINNEKKKLDKVRITYQNCKAGLMSSSFNYECDYKADSNWSCDDHTFAWAGPSFDVHICWIFFDTSKCNTNCQASTIVHEAVHKWGKFSGHPSDPLKNAYKYEEFASSVA